MKTRQIILLTVIMLVYVLIIQQIYLSALNQLLVDLYSLALIILILFGLNYILPKVPFLNINKSQNEIPYLFTLSSLTLLILGGISKLLLGNATIDLQMHDTYFVIARFHIVFLMSLVMAFWGVIYYATPRIMRRKLNKSLSKIHFWTTFYGVILSLISLQLIRTTSAPSRDNSLELVDMLRNTRLINSAITYFLLLIFATQFLYFVNLLYSLVKEQKLPD